MSRAKVIRLMPTKPRDWTQMDNFDRNGSTYSIRLSPYEIDPGNVARRGCAVPDDALDRRVAGEQGRHRRIDTESVRHFCRRLLAAALHFSSTSRIFFR